MPLGSDIRGFDPGVNRDGNTDTVHHHIFESLVAYDSDLKVQPMLAEKFIVSDDFKTFTFYLREGARFHNTELVTANDVAWAWRRMLDPETGWRCRTWYDGTGNDSHIIGIDTPDERTVVFHVSSPSPIFLVRMANVQCFSAIVHRDSFDAEGEVLRPIGTGPYKLSEWRRGEFIKLSAFEQYIPREEASSGYAGSKIAKERNIKFLIVPDHSVSEAGLLTGEIDILPDVPVHLAPLLEMSEDVQLQGTNILTWVVLLVGSKDKVFSDVRMRQALARAIDVNQVANTVSFDRGKANPSAVPVMSPFHTPMHDMRLNHDIPKVKELLEQAKYNGEPILLKTTKQISFLFDSAIAIQAMLTEAGFNVELEVVDWATLLSDYFSGNYTLATFDYSGRTHPTLNYGTFLGEDRSNPAYLWSSPKALALEAEARQADTPEQASQIFEKLHAHMIQQTPIIGLFNRYQLDAVRTNVNGYELWSMGRPRLWNVTKGEAEK
ncbi:ABC transporter substrate-binding protein [Terasakiella pusilla]|uniref:ABC transporter substrate-binding protein n=1 Tax=Terasakiella pusilla TaxID=64973 RepID=UPI003AA8FCDF